MCFGIRDAKNALLTYYLESSEERRIINFKIKKASLVFTTKAQIANRVVPRVSNPGPSPGQSAESFTVEVTYINYTGKPVLVTDLSGVTVQVESDMVKFKVDKNDPYFGPRFIVRRTYTFSRGRQSQYEKMYHQAQSRLLPRNRLKEIIRDDIAYSGNLGGMREFYLDSEILASEIQLGRANVIEDTGVSVQYELHHADCHQDSLEGKLAIRTNDWEEKSIPRSIIETMYVNHSAFNSEHQQKYFHFLNKIYGLPANPNPELPEGIHVVLKYVGDKTYANDVERTYTTRYIPLNEVKPENGFYDTLEIAQSRKDVLEGKVAELTTRNKDLQDDMQKIKREHGEEIGVLRRETNDLKNTLASRTEEMQLMQARHKVELERLQARLADTERDRREAIDKVADERRSSSERLREIQEQSKREHAIMNDRINDAHRLNAAIAKDLEEERRDHRSTGDELRNSRRLLEDERRRLTEEKMRSETERQRLRKEFEDAEELKRHGRNTFMKNLAEVLKYVVSFATIVAAGYKFFGGAAKPV